MKREVLFSSGKDDWETPRSFFQKLNEEFGFDVDLCASDRNHLCPEYYTAERDGARADLTGKTVFCNPPYSKVAHWVEVCATASGADTIVMLIPARTDTRWFHQYIYKKAEIRFIKGRLRFSQATENAQFPSMIVIFNRRYYEDNKAKQITISDIMQEEEK